MIIRWLNFCFQFLQEVIPEMFLKERVSFSKEEVNKDLLFACL